MIDIQSRVEEAKLYEFLKRVSEVAEGDRRRYVPVGGLGETMGLPYEESLRLAEELASRSLVMQEGAMEVPHGPRVRLTPRAARWLRDRAA
jgi:hypothetical protein